MESRGRGAPIRDVNVINPEESRILQQSIGIIRVKPLCCVVNYTAQETALVGH